MWNPNTVRPASGERFRVWRIKLGVGVTWEKLRWRRCETARESESGSLRSSEERECAIGSVWVWVSDEKCLVKKSDEGVKRVREWKWEEGCRGSGGGG